MAIQAVIWDLGGVLVRTEEPNPRKRLAARFGMTRNEIEGLVFGGESGDKAQRGEISVGQHWEAIGNKLGLTQGELNDFIAGFWGGDVLDTTLIDFIRSLRPELKTGLLSNAFSDLRRMLTDVWEIFDVFDEVIISAEVGLVKPDARIYQLAVSNLGVTPNEAVFIDDFPHNVEGARAVNLQAIHFKSTRQTLDNLAEILPGV
jgi:epoxide hydrolase-like predicted phosphatase